VTIAAQPSSRAQTCTVANGSGTVAGADVVVAVECHATTWVLGGITGGATIAKPYVDGPVAVATFSNPWGLVYDAAGNLYVADDLDFVVRKITPDGVVSTYAGSGVTDADGNSSLVDGPAATATFWDPRGLAFGPDGALYVADDFTLRRVTPAGVVTTLAGSEDASCLFDTAGHLSGNPLCGASGIEVDAAGNAFVADTGGNRVQMFAPDGTVTTLIFANSTFFPYGIAMAPDGSFTLADDAQGDNPRIARLAPQ
jgi:hypothetical protein